MAYTLALVSLVGFSSSLITLLPETVLGWIDATLTSGATQDLGRSIAGEASQRPAIGRMEPRNTIPTRGLRQPRADPRLSSAREGRPALPGRPAAPGWVSRPASPVRFR